MIRSQGVSIGVLVQGAGCVKSARRYRGMQTLVGMALALFGVACAFGDTWSVFEGLYVSQSNPSFVEVLPGEDMDPTHVITWGPPGQVRFYPSWSWDVPQPGDDRCWLYGSSSTIVWWQGVFNNPSDSVEVQLRACDSNDGWADIFVDGVLAFSYQSYHATYTDVTLMGTGLTYVAHTVKIQTRLLGEPGAGDVHIDYVAYPAIPEPGTLLLAALGAVVVMRRR